MPLKAKLKFPDIPWDQEYKLIHEGGFLVYARKRGEYVILEKQQNPTKPKTFEVLENGELPASVQLALRRRINNVISLYADPDGFTKEIRGRLERISNTLPKHQARFIMKWMDEELVD